ncbi:hypothetical protein KC363_g1172 [Hortaea werneckii]|uniref:Acyl-coenzyme A diphosphatase SCS3 n=1 Tax=Hortaea werneckii TaxID=91943 RepID=A0A3M7FZZ4_HORWE|nr:hypothetical protein KC363_g1172 [Hortaea werneckii]RMY93941.1 hypothetical protein D0861_01639 [Hortaea werneckii]
MTTRRTATRVEIPVPSSSSTSSSDTKASTTPTMRAASASAHHSPTLPTRLEALLLAIYPTTLLLGSLFSQLSASSRRATYLPDSQAYSAADAPSYFAKKGNVFNVYFVKIGWFWISLAWAGFVFTHRGLSRGNGRQGGDSGGQAFWTRTRLQALARYAVVTGVWILVTQWCFGPALIDRGFRWTGGKCLALSSSSSSLPPPEAAAKVEAMSDVERALTHAACKTVGGRWAGGHDISGHVFLLILGSAMLWLEILPVVLTNATGLREARQVRRSDGNITSSTSDQSGGKEGGAGRDAEPAQNLSFPTKLSLSVAALSWWMLLMTAAFFHTWFEKFTGLVVAFGAIWGVYFLPRGLPGWRRVVGMPGV